MPFQMAQVGNGAKREILMGLIERLERTRKVIAQNIRQIFPVQTVFLAQQCTKILADRKTRLTMSGGFFHTGPLVRTDQVAGNRAAVFGNHIRNTVFLRNFMRQNAAEIHRMRMEDIRLAVFCHIPLKSLHARPYPTDTVDIDDGAMREKIHAVVNISIQTALPVMPHSIRSGQNTFPFRPQRAEQRCNDPYFQTFALQSLSLQTEENPVHIRFGFRIPRWKNDNMHFLLLTPTLPKTICIIAHKVKKYKKQ